MLVEITILTSAPGMNHRVYSCANLQLQTRNHTERQNMVLMVGITHIIMDIQYFWIIDSSRPINLLTSDALLCKIRLSIWKLLTQLPAIEIKLINITREQIHRHDRAMYKQTIPLI